MVEAKETFSIGVCPVYGTEVGEDGPYTVTRFVVEACSSSGHAYHHFKVFADSDKAWALCEKVADAARSGSWSPVDNANWHYERAIYGSAAWSKSDEDYLKRLDVESEYGAGSWGKSGPWCR